MFSTNTKEGLTEEEKEKILKDFKNKTLGNMQAAELEFIEITNRNFWDLLVESKN